MGAGSLWPIGAGIPFSNFQPHFNLKISTKFYGKLYYVVNSLLSGQGGKKKPPPPPPIFRDLFSKAMNFHCILTYFFFGGSFFGQFPTVLTMCYKLRKCIGSKGIMYLYPLFLNFLLNYVSLVFGGFALLPNYKWNKFQYLLLIIY